MLLISSKWTFFHKKIFPVLWFGLIALGIAGVAVAARHAPGAVPAIAFAIPLFLGLIGYLVLKYLVFDLLDEVWDDGDRLKLVKGGAEDTVLLTDILNISDTFLISPPRITLLLRQPCRFGREVVFSPKIHFNAFKRSPVALDLIRRVHKL